MKAALRTRCSPCERLFVRMRAEGEVMYNRVRIEVNISTAGRVSKEL